MSLRDQFNTHIRNENLFQRSDNLLLAVSGGVDSVVLCELCHQAGYTFSIAHANFQLRGPESDEDEQFVRTIAEKYKVPVHVRLFETEQYAQNKKISVQTAARELRYNWFDELLKAGHAWLLTAHHADDNIETMLMNFFRGSGISGLRGIVPKTGNIVRPLLPFKKVEITAFAVEQSLAWREDSSNASEKYSRNYFRNAIMPLVKNIYPEAENNLLENLRRFRETEELYTQSIQLHKRKLIEQRGNELHIPVLKLKKSSPLRTIVYEVISEYGFSAHQVSEVVHLLDAEQGKLVRSASHRIIVNRGWLIIAPIETQDAPFIIIEKDEPHPLLQIEAVEKMTSDIDNRVVAHVDGGLLLYPLILRKWKQGDYFYPLGMPKKKKLSRFLIDNKLSATQKERVLVLESGKRICWVAGLRIDDRFKVMPHTKNIVRLSFRGQAPK